MTTPTISVCVPVYNGAKYIEACLAGIAAQTFEDFEVLIVDDCSTDGGMSIAQRWAAADARFCVHVNERNLGLVGNWNHCLELSRGKWIKYLFQDDLMAPNCLAEMLAAARDGSGFVACARGLIFEGDIDPSLVREYGDHGAVLARTYANRRRLSGETYADAMLSELCWNIVGEPSVTMIDRSLFDRFGHFDPMLVQLCDSEMWNRIGCNVGIDYLDKELVSFRVHRGSASEVNRGRNFRSSVLDEIILIKRLCTGAAYERFRHYASASGKLRALKRTLRHRVNAAFDKAMAAASERPPDRTLQQDLRQVLQQLPGYTTARLVHLVHIARRLAGATE